MRAVLNDEQRDDLRAALERRPIIKQGGFAGAVALSRVVPAPPLPPQSKVMDLVLRQ
jgi:hypothetical protein